MVKAYLAISTSDPDKNFLGVWRGYWSKHKIFKASCSESFFMVWRKFISREELSQLKGVVVHQGAGSYSGLRLSAVVANALKIAFPKLELGQVITQEPSEFIKLVEKKRWKREKNFVLPQYPSPPKIG